MFVGGPGRKLKILTNSKNWLAEFGYGKSFNLFQILVRVGFQVKNFNLFQKLVSRFWLG